MINQHGHNPFFSGYFLRVNILVGDFCEPEERFLLNIGRIG